MSIASPLYCTKAPCLCQLHRDKIAGSELNSRGLAHKAEGQNAAWNKSESQCNIRVKDLGV